MQIKKYFNRYNLIAVLSLTTVGFATMCLHRYIIFINNSAFACILHENGIIEINDSSILNQSTEGRYVYISGEMKADELIVQDIRNTNNEIIEQKEFDALIVDYSEEEYKRKRRGGDWRTTYSTAAVATNPHIGSIGLADDIFIEGIKDRELLFSLEIDDKHRVQIHGLKPREISLIAFCHDNKLQATRNSEGLIYRLDHPATVNELLDDYVNTPKKQSQDFGMLSLGLFLLTLLLLFFQKTHSDNSVTNNDMKLTKKILKLNQIRRLIHLCAWSIVGAAFVTSIWINDPCSVTFGWICIIWSFIVIIFLWSLVRKLAQYIYSTWYKKSIVKYLVSSLSVPITYSKKEESSMQDLVKLNIFRRLGAPNSNYTFTTEDCFTISAPDFKCKIFEFDIKEKKDKKETCIMHSFYLNVTTQIDSSLDLLIDIPSSILLPTVEMNPYTPKSPTLPTVFPNTKFFSSQFEKCDELIENTEFVSTLQRVKDILNIKMDESQIIVFLQYGVLHLFVISDKNRFDPLFQKSLKYEDVKKDYESIFTMCEIAQTLSSL